MTPRPAGVLLVAVAAGMSVLAVVRALGPLPVRHPARVERLLGTLDLDGDGVVGAWEYGALAHPATPMARFDLDGNQVLDALELEVFLVAVDPNWFICSVPPSAPR